MPEDVRLGKSHRCDYEAGHEGQHHSGVGMGAGYFWPLEDEDTLQERLEQAEAENARLREQVRQTLEENGKLLVRYEHAEAERDALRAKAATACEVYAKHSASSVSKRYWQQLQDAMNALDEALKAGGAP